MTRTATGETGCVTIGFSHLVSLPVTTRPRRRFWNTYSSEFGWYNYLPMEEVTITFLRHGTCLVLFHVTFLEGVSASRGLGTLSSGNVRVSRVPISSLVNLTNWVNCDTIWESHFCGVTLTLITALVAIESVLSTSNMFCFCTILISAVCVNHQIYDTTTTVRTVCDVATICFHYNLTSSCRREPVNVYLMYPQCF